jgi:hypothetical protein
MSSLEELSNLHELVGEWAQFGQVDLSAWQADDVLAVIAMNPDISDKFVAMLELRLGGAVQ